MHVRAAELIKTLDLKPHPEGGFYRELFRSATTVMPEDDRGARAALTTIYFLLAGGALSRWHRVASDEVWHLYEGGPLEVLDLDLAARRLERHRLATVAGDAARPTCVIVAGRWQATRSLGPYALMGCTVGPGFEFADFRLMASDPVATHALHTEWPDQAAWL
jgi:predicted cupin superfamily sugar epimerase